MYLNSRITPITLDNGETLNVEIENVLRYIDGHPATSGEFHLWRFEPKIPDIMTAEEVAEYLSVLNETAPERDIEKDPDYLGSMRFNLANTHEWFYYGGNLSVPERTQIATIIGASFRGGKDVHLN